MDLWCYIWQQILWKSWKTTECKQNRWKEWKFHLLWDEISRNLSKRNETSQCWSKSNDITRNWSKWNGWLCWGLTSQSTIFQSCRDGAIASWVFNQYFRGVKCLAQGHNTAAVGLEPRTSRSGVRHSTTEPPRSP